MLGAPEKDIRRPVLRHDLRTEQVAVVSQGRATPTTARSGHAYSRPHWRERTRPWGSLPQPAALECNGVRASCMGLISGRYD
jgi:hypothetical protein